MPTYFFYFIIQKLNVILRPFPTMSLPPPFLLFAQHGWADTSSAIHQLATTLAPPDRIITPNLGWFKTWVRIEPLIQQVEAIALQQLQTHPNAPWRILGHSMGGLIWLELLDQHPEWRPRVHSLVLVASPVGGSKLAHYLDPFQWGLGIARDLAKNRRSVAENIAQQIPTLSIGGSVFWRTDATIHIKSTQFKHSQLKTVSVLHHPLKNHPCLTPIIQEFWQKVV